MIKVKTKRYTGYSSEIKPTNVNIGDRFLEIDTINEYIFVGYNKWNMLSTGGSGTQGYQGNQGFQGSQIKGPQGWRGTQGFAAKVGNQGPASAIITNPGLPIGSVQFNGNATFSGSDKFIYDTTNINLIVGNNSLLSAPNSVIFGENNCLNSSVRNSAIISGNSNYMISIVRDSIIIGGSGSYISDMNYSIIIGGYKNSVSEGGQLASSIGGSCNNSFQSTGGNFIGGFSNCFFDDCYLFDNRSVIVGGYQNMIYTNTFNSSIIASSFSVSYGIGNDLTSILFNSSLIAGVKNTLCCGIYNSVIIGGDNNIVCCQISDSAIIGSTGSLITNRACNSAIIGGKELILDGDQNTLLSPNISIVGSSDFDISDDGGGIQVSNDGGTSYKFGISCNFATYTCLCFLNGVLVCKLP